MFVFVICRWRLLSNCDCDKGIYGPSFVFKCLNEEIVFVRFFVNSGGGTIICSGSKWIL